MIKLRKGPKDVVCEGCGAEPVKAYDGWEARWLCEKCSFSEAEDSDSGRQVEGNSYGGHFNRKYPTEHYHSTGFHRAVK